MKNLWITFFGGKIQVKVEGKGVERLINQLTRSHLTIWNVKRQGTTAITFFMRLQDLHKLRHQSRKYDCKISFLNGQGAPFLWKRVLKNSGFFTGFLLFFIVITILSNIIWGIQIKGASPQLEHQIRKELDKLGIHIGKLQFFVDDVETIQRKLEDRIPELTWIGVELNGTTFHFQVVEKTIPEPPEKKSPQDLVATKKAVIVDTFVENGQQMVKINQYVKKGQLLVSGTIGNEHNEKQVAAIGKIYGKTWYKSTVEMPLESDFQVYTGKEKRKYSLNFGSVKVPLWGFGKIEYNEYDSEKEPHKINFIKWSLPVKYEETTVREKENVKRKYSEKQAIDAAKEKARNDLKSKIPTDAKVVDEYVLHEKVENGKVNLSIYFQVIENIAIEKPIIQGDIE
ncbi:sporulation protein YqfD [Heyndrickxia oleronia]|uniref:sporulation protein YqfD n=1 Tax=Heyndrickxia oleronia TaxID=38875 RepID=UPI0020407174|nr:sporulation protein YqfD [Heyndrickxia oleronia]MCM3237044.1 sporulation protein YqfD [Heyndrickxia oleronia]